MLWVVWTLLVYRSLLQQQGPRWSQVLNLRSDTLYCGDLKRRKKNIKMLSPGKKLYHLKQSIKILRHIPTKRMAEDTVDVFSSEVPICISLLSIILRMTPNPGCSWCPSWLTRASKSPTMRNSYILFHCLSRFHKNVPLKTAALRYQLIWKKRKWALYQSNQGEREVPKVESIYKFVDSWEYINGSFMSLWEDAAATPFPCLIKAIFFSLSFSLVSFFSFLLCEQLNVNYISKYWV